MKYIYRKFVKDIDLSELDLINQDEILGENVDGHDYDIITVIPKGRQGYYDECEEIEIDTAIKSLQKLKKAGANYAQILSHIDHHGYEFYGLEMRVATKEEVGESKAEKKKAEKNEIQSKIDELEKQLSKLKNKKPVQVFRKTFDGKIMAYSNLDHQHLSNIYWFNTIIHDRHHNYDDALLQEFLNRFEGKILDYKPLKRFDAEIRLLRKSGFVEKIDDVEVIKFNGKIVGKLEK